MNRKLTVRENLFVFFCSLVFALAPIIVVFVGSFLGLVDTTPVPAGMNQAEGILLFSVVTFPIGLLAALVSIVNAIFQYFKSRTSSQLQK